MRDEKIHCSTVAREYGKDYWDGDRRYGYGGYTYDGRWGPIAEAIIERYALKPDAAILDVGCGKAHLLYELQQRLPEAKVRGFDISRYGIDDAPASLEGCLFEHRAEDPFPFEDGEFDFVMSLMALHNLTLPGLHKALTEMARVGRQGYIAVESYRTVAELHNLECWALTCESFLRPEEWCWMFERAGFAGDYEFAYFE